MKPLAVVDAHVHFWNPEMLSYPWLSDAPLLDRTFLPADYAPLAACTVDDVVFVEANCAPMQAESEVELIDKLATVDARIAGIVAFVDLTREDTRHAALSRVTTYERVVGIRHNIQGHPRGYCLQPAFVRGVQEVGRAGRTFDLCVTAVQLPDVIALVDECPDTRFVLDHCGKPAIRDDAFSSWAADVADLAQRENVWCKLSGLLTEARPAQRTYEELSRYAGAALESFGHARLIYGSDWPVVILGGGVDKWRVFVDRLTAGWSDADRQSFYADNAIRFYGLRLHADC